MMNTLHLLCCILLSFPWSCLAAKIVIVPMFGRSHYMAMNVVAEELDKRGHEVHMALPDFDAGYAKGKPFVHMYPITGDLDAYTNFNMASMNPIQTLQFLVNLQVMICQSLFDSNFVKELNGADLVVGDTLFACSAVLAAKLDVPHVSMLLGSLSLSLIHPMGVPAPLAYVPNFASALPSNMNFLQRVKNVFFSIPSTLMLRWIWFDLFDEMIAKNGLTDKGIEELLADTEIVLFQGDFAIEVAQPLPPVIKMVGPLQPKPASPLPENFKEIMDSSGDDGVVIMAFGTVKQAAVSEEVSQAIARALGRLPMKVIWKKEGGENLSIGANTKLIDWLPQNDLLGHPKTKVFITHSGHNGIYEAAYHGVPMVACPLFGDQFDNSVHIEEKELGIMVDVHNHEGLEQRLYDAIMTVVKGESYKLNSAKVSRALKHRTRLPREEATDWIEHVLEVGKMNHLKPAGNRMPFYQLYLLDVLAFLLVIIMFVVFVLRFMFKTCCKLFSSKKEKIN